MHLKDKRFENRDVALNVIGLCTGRGGGGGEGETSARAVVEIRDAVARLNFVHCLIEPKPSEGLRPLIALGLQ